MFGINLKKYIAHFKTEIKVGRRRVDAANYTEAEKLDLEQNEGAYIFKPNWRNPLPS